MIENSSGIKPMKYKVLVKPVKIKEKTSGGIYMPDTARDKEKYATVKGSLIDYGAIAFSDPDWRERPHIGDTILFDRYAGGLELGQDDEEYRLINDSDIKAILVSKE